MFCRTTSCSGFERQQSVGREQLGKPHFIRSEWDQLVPALRELILENTLPQILVIYLGENDLCDVSEHQ